MKMTGFTRKLLAGMTVLALMVTLAATLPGSSDAANLTSGNYTYIINGEEATFPHDPLSRQAGLLLPVEVFQRFDVAVVGALTRNIQLKRPEISVSLVLGSTASEVNGKTDLLALAPVRLNGRLFVPADVLLHFGIDYSVDGNYVTMSDLAKGGPTVNLLTDQEFKALKVGRTITASTRTSTNFYLQSEFTLLSEELLTADKLSISYGTRARLQSLSQTNTLVMVALSNASIRAGTLVTDALILVDDQRQQYDLVTTFDIGQGAITSKIAPGADRIGVLVFPKVPANIITLTLFYDTHGANLGSFTNLGKAE